MVYKLKEICDFYSGTGFPIAYQGETEGELPFYKVGDISANVAKGYSILHECNNYISRQDARKLKGTILPPNTVVFAKIGEALKLNRRALTRVDCLIDNNVMGICPKSCVDTKFFFYFMQRLKMEFLAESTTVPSVRKSRLEEVEIYLPNIEKQQQIVEVLDRISGIIESRRQQLSALDALIKARFVEMFGGCDEYVEISELCDVSGGYSFKSGDINIDGDIRILQIGNVYIDNVDWKTINYLPEGFDDKYSKFLLKENDIVIALTRPIIQSLGNVKACLVKAGDLPCLLNQRVGRIVVKPFSKVNMRFLYGCLMTEEFTRYVESCCIGCSQPNISTKDIENYQVPKISIETQNDFAAFVSQVDKSKVAVQKALDEAQVLFDSLMQKYFG